MFKFQRLAVLLCATGILTSSVSMTDGTWNETHADTVKHFHNPLDVSSNSNSETKPSHKLSNDDTQLPIMGESGPIYQSTQRIDSSRNNPKTLPKATVVAEGIKITSDDLVSTDSESKVQKIRNPSVVPRKGAIPPSKIAARKGVGLESFLPDESTLEGVDEAIPQVVSRVDDTHKKKIEPSAAGIVNNRSKFTIEPKALPDHIGTAVPTTNKNVSDVSHAKNNSATSPQPANVTPTIETNNLNLTTSANASTKRFKPKPTVTIGEIDIDKPIPASPTKTPPLGMPRKIDYIVPVIITIMALPVLGAAAFFLYKRGRDCWDKRHYRRMDFLIDGMYNDHTSWK